LSINNKYDDVSDVLKDMELDALVAADTWLLGDISF